MKKMLLTVSIGSHSFRWRKDNDRMLAYPSVSSVQQELHSLHSVGEHWKIQKENYFSEYLKNTVQIYSSIESILKSWKVF